MVTTQTVLTFRKATTADARDTQALIKSAFRGDSSRAGWTTEADLVDDDRIDEAGVIAKINQTNGLVLLAHDNSSALVGCCEIQGRDGGFGYFGLLAVDPLRQAGGLGKKILAEAEVMARDHLGVRVMEMRVIWPRQEMIDWYIRRGYTKTDRTESFPYAHLVNGKALSDDLYFVIMEKELLETSMASI
jgi:GNAT superfamily N-acetyltransferase